MARVRVVSGEQKRARLVKQSADINWSRMSELTHYTKTDIARMHPNASINELKQL